MVNRKEQILTAAMNKENKNDIKSWIEGVLWADENPVDGSRDLLMQANKFFNDIINNNYYDKKDLYEFLNELSEYLK